MKQTLLITFFLICACSLHTTAQTSFAPIGAKWHYNMGYGAFEYTADKDTVIQGITATRLRERLLVQPSAPEIWEGGDYHVVVTPDTVFIYNFYFDRFTPLYVFNVSEGDTVCLPTLPSGLIYEPEDSTFCYVVDSIRVLPYDTAHLRTYFTRFINLYGSAFGLNWGKSDTFGAYAERIGGIYTGFLPECLWCPIPLSTSVQYRGKLRCYSDAGYRIQLTDNDCNNGGMPQSVASLADRKKTIAISPVPTRNFLYLHTNGESDIVQISLINIEGKEVFSSLYTGSVPVQQFPNGVYMIQLMFDDGSRYIQRVILGHF